MLPLVCSLALRGGRDSSRSGMRSLAQRALDWLKPHSSSGSSSDAQTTPKCLFSLPNEILDIIIEHVVLDHSHTAPSPSDESRRQASSKSIFPDAMTRMQIHVQPKPMANSVSLFACHKLADLTRAVVRRLEESDRIVFKLDVLLIGERQLRTTWLFLPFVPKRIRQLEISIRIAGGHQELIHPTRPDHLLASAIRNRYHSLNLSFQYLLAAVLCRGARLDLRDGERRRAAQDDMPRDQPTLVDNLHIDISTCEGIPVAANGEYQNWLLARPEREIPVQTPQPPVTAALQSLAMRPDWLADMLNTAFSDIVLSEEHDCQLFFNRIGDASILVEGVTYLHLDLGEKFAGMKPDSDIGEGWWHESRRRRLERHFSVSSEDQSLASTSTESILLPASDQDHN